ncbi:hypothetical protein PGT21_008529 [Puccinia graminis f. sp. tritici]|uniref:Uncharacterized protein n=1 Tax=Puccinia graminis f. sp. tritici TaxID=56615 RepID=A0A5B0Q2F2_PUCGR|nr:hypothetical protein PGT21_008529 [Puccinia graminis f. sp. tritici]
MYNDLSLSRASFQSLTSLSNRRANRLRPPPSYPKAGRSRSLRVINDFNHDSSSGETLYIRHEAKSTKKLMIRSAICSQNKS